MIIMFMAYFSHRGTDAMTRTGITGMVNRTAQKDQFRIIRPKSSRFMATTALALAGKSLVVIVIVIVIVIVLSIFIMTFYFLHSTFTFSSSPSLREQRINFLLLVRPSFSCFLLSRCILPILQIASNL